MDINTIEHLINQLDEMIECMFVNEETCFVALEVAQHLRDELIQLIPEETDNE